MVDNEQRILIAKKAVAQALFGSTVDYALSYSLKDSYPAPITWEVVGSTYIQDKTDSDVDIIVLVNSNPSEHCIEGWAFGGSRNEGDPDTWESWKTFVDGVNVNMILTHNRDYFYDWLKAAEACRFIHLKGLPMTNGLVHGIHQIIMDGAVAEEELKYRNY